MKLISLFLRGIGRALLSILNVTIALVFVGGLTAALANYTMTQGSGTTFGSIVVSTIHYAQQLICDPTTPSQCGAVNASGSQQMDWTNSSQAHTDITSPPTLGSASGGLLTGFQGALSTTVTAVQSVPAAGQLYELYCYNPNASVAFVQIFDLATASVTLGTTPPKLSYGIPPTNSDGFAVALVGTQFSTAISIAATTTYNGLTAPGTGLTCNEKYK